MEEKKYIAQNGVEEITKHCKSYVEESLEPFPLITIINEEEINVLFDGEDNNGN